MKKNGITFILLSSLAVLIYFYFFSKDKEIHLIPENYIGWVLIAFDQPKGIELSFEDKRKVYNIPKSGILKVKNSFTEGTFSKDELLYYIVNENGERSKIKAFAGWITNYPYKDSISFLRQDEYFIHAQGIMGGNFKASDGGLFYFVGTINDTTYAKDTFEKFLESSNDIIQYKN